MEITEEKVYEAFGLEAPAAQPEQQDTAEAATEEPVAAAAQQDAAETQRDVQDPAPEQQDAAQEQAEPVETSDAGAAETPNDAGEAQTPNEMTPEQRSKNAERRRRDEQRRRERRQAEIDAAVQKAIADERAKQDQELAQFFKQAKLKNPITGEQIENIEQARAWQQAYEDKRIEDALSKGTLSREVLDDVIAKHPSVQRAEELIRQQTQQEQRQQQEQADARIEQELAQIRQLDPSIETVGDLLRMPKAKEFQQYVRRGNTFLDAYYLANREQLQQQAVAAARQQALNNARSKDHLAPAAARGSGAASVPSEQMALFREFLPAASDAEIQAYYNKYYSGKA